MEQVPVNRRPEHWMVQGRDVASGQLTEHIKDDPEIREVRRIAPDVIVLSMSEERKEQLKSRFGEQLKVEPDFEIGP